MTQSRDNGGQTAHCQLGLFQVSPLRYRHPIPEARDEHPPGTSSLQPIIHALHFASLLPSSNVASASKNSDSIFILVRYSRVLELGPACKPATGLLSKETPLQGIDKPTKQNIRRASTSFSASIDSRYCTYLL